jgi:hypothetical protein
MASQRFQDAEARGRRLLDRLNQRIQNPSTEDAICDPIEVHYKVQVSLPESALGFLYCKTINALVDENVSLNDWQLVNIYSAAQNDAAYINPIEGSIICWSNYKERDTNAPENRLQWSEAMFEAYQMLAIRSLQSVKNIRTIWRYWIVNKDTVAIITEGGGQQVENTCYTQFRVGESAFYALLGSPNGSGVVRMLTEHAQAFGRKTIESVRVLKDVSPPTMYFVLSEAEILPVKSQVSKSHAKRLASREAKSEGKRHKRDPSRDEPPGSLRV